MIAGYRLEEQVGQGGMAVVYRARDERLDRRVALKLLAPGLASDTAFRQRFIRESRAAAAVDHPNIIPVYDAGDAGGALFIAMRYVQGGDVRTLLAQNGPLPASRAWGIITQVAAALDAAHVRGLIHRDVKPANILLDTAEGATAPDHVPPGGNSPEHVYLSDFGISKQSLASQQLTSTGQFVGTLEYIAPEQIEGRNVDGRTDQYALGCAAFELLSGTPPFRSDNAFALLTAHLSAPPPALALLRTDLPVVVDQVLARAMSKSPDRRYATCAQFAADLGRALGLMPGAIEALNAPATPVAPAASAGDQPKPWPGTELAGLPSAPETNPSHQAAAGQAPGTAPQIQPAALQYPATQGPTGAPSGFVHPATQAGQPDPRGGTASPGASGQAGPYGQPPYGQPPQGPGPYGPQQYGQQQYGQQQYGPGQYGPGQYGPGQYGPGQYGPGQYGQQQYGPGPQPPPARRSRAMVVAVAIAAVVLVSAGGVFAVVKLKSGPTPAPTPPISSSTPPTPTPTPAPGRTAQSEANAINRLLPQAAASRRELVNAVAEVSQCANLSGAVSQIQQSVNDRSAELSTAQGLPIGKLPDGATLKSDLVQALQYSLNADNDYLSWAKAQENGCVGGSPSNVTTDNDGATQYKDLFATIWNQQIASQYGESIADPSNM